MLKYLLITFAINTVVLWGLHRFHMKSYEIHLETVTFPNFVLHFRELFYGIASLGILVAPLLYYFWRNELSIGDSDIITVSLCLIAPNISNIRFAYIRHQFEKENYIVSRYPLGNGR